MQRIIKSLGLLAGAAAIIGVGATGAFFSDTETSSGNTFAAGAIDLKIDNTSYYNGVVSSSTTWSLDDLQNSAGVTIHKFFNFLDLKPNDYSEDTISLHVQNDAYICADILLTSNDDNTPTEPESLVDLTTGPGQGELAQNINFLWWADDGDNVLEAGENLLPGGPLGALTLGATTTTPIADSSFNIFNPNNAGGPVTANVTHYIGKAWCFGAISAAPLTQSSNGSRPTTTPAQNGDGVGAAGQPTDGGYTCDGSALGNETQTDSATVDVTFRAIQSRNNPRFSCGGNDNGGNTAKITITKNVINDNGGNNIIGDFALSARNETTVTSFPATSGVQITVPVDPGGTVYSVREVGVTGYQATFGGDCDPSTHRLTLNPGDVRACTITNDDLPANITLVKVVDTGTAVPSDFELTVDGTIVPQNASFAVTSNTPHAINEHAEAGYHFVSIVGAGCPAALGGTVTLSEGQAITCTIHNAHN
ncbi:M73 family metallopeptidase [Candidatus Parcubacteria bacterium]|nr:M73 family metallopeptidase [Candidatus Parcubacteria bacterium]